MMRAMVAPSHLKSLQALELAVRTGSFSAAAELLGITPAAVGQRVKTLEDYLGIALLARGKSGITPTPELLKALPHLATGFAGVETAAAVLDMQRPQQLHITADRDFAELWLKPRLDRFCTAHPNLRLCVNGDGETRAARADLEISFGVPAADDACDLLFHDLVLPIASPANVRRTRELPVVDRLEGFPLLHLDFYKDEPGGGSWPRWCADNGIARTAPERGIRFQRIVDLVDAVDADAGMGLCGLALLSGAIDEGRIMLPFPEVAGRPTRQEFVARYRAPGPGNRQVAWFRQWLRAEAEATAAWLAGQASIGGNR